MPPSENPMTSKLIRSSARQKSTQSLVIAATVGGVSPVELPTPALSSRMTSRSHANPFDRRPAAAMAYVGGVGRGDHRRNRVRGWLVGEGDPPLDCHVEAVSQDNALRANRLPASVRQMLSSRSL